MRDRQPRVSAMGLVDRPAVVSDNECVTSPARPNGNREMYAAREGFTEDPVFERDEVGHEILGPAIIEEYGSTAVVPAAWKASPDPFGNLNLTGQKHERTDAGHIQNGSG